MIGTIGFLVQDTSNRLCWLLSASLYTLACIGTATLLGTLLSLVGCLLHIWLHGLPVFSMIPRAEIVFVGLLAIAYAVSDVG